jgi:hypothetical protein
MKTSFSCGLILLLTFLALSCNDDDASSSPNSPSSKTKLITTEDEAKFAFAAVKNFWLNTAKPTVPNEKVTVNKTFTGGSGSVTVTGSVSYTKSTSSTSIFESKITDVTGAFSAYSSGGVVSKGSVRFFDSYSYESRCSSSACASSTKNKITISSSKITVEFDYGGKQIKDDISIDGFKEFTSWDVRIKNSSGISFDWLGS